MAYKRSVFLSNEPLPDDGDTYIQVPKGNDRMWQVTIFNRGRMRSGTATIYRWWWVLRGVKARWPRCVMTPKTLKREEPIKLRSRVAGPVVAICVALDGPIARVATKH